jgi:hypothetical protein
LARSALPGRSRFVLQAGLAVSLGRPELAEPVSGAKIGVSAGLPLSGRGAYKAGNILARRRIRLRLQDLMRAPPDDQDWPKSER